MSRIGSILSSCGSLFWANKRNTFSKGRYISQLAKSILALQDDGCSEPPLRGVVLGVYTDEDDLLYPGILTPSAYKYNKTKTSGKLLEILRMSGPLPKRGQVRPFFDLEDQKFSYYTAVAVVGLGKECLGYNNYEIVDEGKEAIRRAAAAGTRYLQELHIQKIDIDNMGHAESAAEGATMGAWAYQEFRKEENRLIEPIIDLFTFPDEDCDWNGWKIGIEKAEAQNLTRELQEIPSNHLTPTIFAQNVVQILCKSGVNVEVKVKGWAESQSMNAFLAVGKASCEPPIFLELSYYGGQPDEKPIVLIGQGVTYDCGGLSLKPHSVHINGRGGMTGAAVVVATCKAIAGLRLPVNIRGLIPLCENVLGCNAFRPGDVYKAMNGKNIEVQGTDNDEVLVLVDALLYAQQFCPKFIVDVGTPARAMSHTLDEAANGIFTNSEILWQQVKNSSIHTGDRVWRMPLWKYYTKQVTASGAVDVQNFGLDNGGAPCKMAAILREFVPCGQWLHIDCTNTMLTNGKDFEYLREGMAGRPTRTLIEFLAQIVCRDTAPKVQ